MTWVALNWAVLEFTVSGVLGGLRIGRDLGYDTKLSAL
jgi:hypothetical protein